MRRVSWMGADDVRVFLGFFAAAGVHDKTVSYPIFIHLICVCAKRQKQVGMSYWCITRHLQEIDANANFDITQSQ